MADTNFYTLTIDEVKPETQTAVRVGFKVPEALKHTFVFNPGQFLTLQITIDGTPVRRSYSICSGVDDGHLRVGIKRVRGGVFSNHANDHFKVGDSIEVMPPQGQFSPQLDAKHQKNYMCLAVGSGITPILSIISSLLSREPQSMVSLVYGNKRTNTVMFKEELSFLKSRYLNRFKWVNIMSQEDQGSDTLKGKVDNKRGYLLQKHKIINILETSEAFICGPESMISEVSHGFRLEGLANEQIHYELFSNSSADSDIMLEKSRQRIQQYGEDKTSKVTVISDGRAIDFDLATVGSNILDAGMDNGIELPYSCKAGVCSTCKAKLIKGQVDMDISHGLEPHEVEAGFILTCQAHPVSDEVIVSFDDR
ncbi:MAG: 2Fe-2S iron-sulfur cluster-binding protein [Gammaproteobacteria bacterium]|nr:2Fe-2S iron-sulfur cluster-binding protein [Gammaproteobacteria bacterium]